nr:MAG TPA: hypothetical protein [Caudoviricetes sp.]
MNTKRSYAEHKKIAANGNSRRSSTLCYKKKSNLKT